ncbi:MAG: septal ring lytic transglycosylase RlpA family protein [Methylophagaceae bacterium]
MIKTQLKLLFTACLYVLLVACGGGTVAPDRAPTSPQDVSNVPNAVPQDEPKSKYGNPAHYEVFGKRYYTLNSSKGYHEKGVASWYGKKFHGRRTSSGETYDMYAMTAAHKTLPLPTYVEVTNLANGKKIIVKVNDRGPFHDNRLIDLSYTAAKKLGIISKGTGTVEIRAITKNDNYASPAQVTTVANNDYVGLYLQVGAFSTLTSAEQLKAKLQRQIGDAILIAPLKKPEGNLYRVRVGPLSNVEYGDSLAKQLVDLGFYDAHIVVE